MGELDFSAYKGKRVLITGHTGFKGSWLSLLMIKAGAEVAGYALAPTYEGSHFELLDLENKLAHFEGDIRDSEKLKSVFSSFEPEVVFHLAAQAIVKESYTNPKETYDVNVMGSLSVLECVKESDSVTALIYITSDKCYENVEWVWGYKETDKLGGHDPYSASKAAAEILFSSYVRSFLHDREDFQAVSVRAGNVVGGGDYSDSRIVPDCVRAIEKGEAIELRHPNSTRPWQHVLEPLSGYISVGAAILNGKQMNGDSYNFGPNTQTPTTVEQVAEKIVDVFGKGQVISADVASDFHEANLLQLNCDKAHADLGWFPKWGVQDTLNITASWYKRVAEGEQAIDVTTEQIELYFGNML